MLLQRWDRVERLALPGFLPVIAQLTAVERSPLEHEGESAPRQEALDQLQRVDRDRASASA
jgi:hypothetical protein